MKRFVSCISKSIIMCSSSAHMPIIHMGFLFLSTMNNRTIKTPMAIGVIIRCANTWYGKSV